MTKERAKQIAKRDWHKWVVSVGCVFLSFFMYQGTTYFKERDGEIDKTIQSINALTNKLQNYIDVHEQKHNFVDYRISELENCHKIMFGKYKINNSENNIVNDFAFSKKNLQK